MTPPDWLTILATVSLSVAGLCFVVIVVDLISGHGQHMWIMNVVWPISALYFGPIALWAYGQWGRLSSHAAVRQAQQQGKANPGMKKSFWQMCAVGALHCGSGCTLGDLVAEWILYLFPLVLFGRTIFGTWAVDFLLAFLFGIAFQYFTIKPMRHLSTSKGLWTAIKADTLSLSAWQAGMYGWMAVATFLIFGHELDKTRPVFWFMMQIAMWLGFATSYPVNWWLLKSGIKEKM